MSSSNPTLLIRCVKSPSPSCSVCPRTTAWYDTVCIMAWIDIAYVRHSEQQMTMYSFFRMVCIFVDTQLMRTLAMAPIRGLTISRTPSHCRPHIPTKGRWQLSRSSFAWLNEKRTVPTPSIVISPASGMYARICALSVQNLSCKHALSREAYGLHWRWDHF